MSVPLLIRSVAAVLKRAGLQVTACRPGGIAPTGRLDPRVHGGRARQQRSLELAGRPMLPARCARRGSRLVLLLMAPIKQALNVSQG